MKKDPIMEAKLEELWRNGHAEELRYLSDSRFNILMNSVFLGMLAVVGARAIDVILIEPMLQKLKDKTK